MDEQRVSGPVQVPPAPSQQPTPKDKAQVFGRTASVISDQ